MNIEFLDLPTLSKGAHEPGSNQLCAMEFVAFIECLPHTDSPSCTCPVIAGYTRSLNDKLPDKRRNELLPLLPMLVGTVKPELEQERANYLVFKARDWALVALSGNIEDEYLTALKHANTVGAIKVEAGRAGRRARAGYPSQAAYSLSGAADDALFIRRASSAAAVAFHVGTVWDDAIATLSELVALDPDHTPAVWTPADYERGFEVMA